MDTNENTKGRASYSGEERRELVAEFQSSGLTKAAFCREWGINPATFAQWLRNDANGSAGKVAFCEVELGDTAAWKGEVRLLLPNRVEVAVAVASHEQLGKVLREAAGCLD